MNNEDILNLKIDSAIGTVTIRDYFKKVLIKLWNDEDSNGKHMFGHGPWKFDVYKALIKAGAIEGTLDEDGYIDKLNINDADKFIIQLIAYIFD
jgi:hypothetical protein